MFGAGTSNSPYYGDFDYIWDNQPTNITGHLLPGVFYSKGNANQNGTNNWDLWLQQGQKLIGAGTNVTIIQRQWGFPYQATNDNVVIGGTGNGIVVSNLTIDCNNTNGVTSQYKGDAIWLKGSSESIQWVQAINAYGNLSYDESFSIMCGFWLSPMTTNNLIDHCSVSAYQGNYQSAITLPGSGVIQFCNVLFTNSTCGHGYTFASSTNALCISNSCTGGEYAFYQDSWDDSNVQIVSNYFNCSRGVYFALAPSLTASGVSIIGNRIDILPTGPSAGIFFGQYSTSNQYSSLNIVGNIISGVDAGSGIVIQGASYVTNVNNVLWTSNVVSNAGNIIAISSSSNTVTANNLIYAPGGNATGIYINDPQGPDVFLNNEIIGCNGSSLFFFPDYGYGNIVLCDSNLFSPSFTNSYYNLTQWQTFGFDTHSIVANPLQVSPTTGNFALTAASPARNAGANLTSLGITTDASGAARPATGNWDIGPYQWQPPTLHGIITGGSMFGNGSIQ